MFQAFTRTICFLTLVAALSVTTACGQRSPTDHAGEYTARSVDDDANRDSTNANLVAEHLEQLAKGIQGVEGANCVVFGKYAIVGINVSETMERSRVGTVKYAVAEAFRKDPYGVDALVTADIDIAQRLREIRADMSNGRFIAGVAEELADIVGRLMPQVPREIIPPAEPENSGLPAEVTE